MEINPQARIYNYQTLGENISFAVTLKLPTIVLLAPFSPESECQPRWAKAFICHCQNSRTPIRSLYLQFLQNYLNSTKKTQTLSIYKPRLIQKDRTSKGKFLLTNSRAIQCDLSAMKAVGVGGVRSRIHVKEHLPQQ